MLSTTTIQILEELAQRSHLAYSEGGLLYTFTEAANQSHCRFPTTLRERCHSRLPEDERKQLAVVVGKSLGSPSLTESDEESFSIADDLVQCLESDLKFTSIGVIVDDYDDYCWGATIHMKRETDNRYFSLYLWGSID